MGLRRYHEKRDFARTPEPRGTTTGNGRARARSGGNSFVIQKHAARRLHHDFRLELDGVLLSWAVPKGPPTEPGTKVLAVRTEDHPLEYGAFEGVIPAGEYGGGTVMLWDRGTWQPDGDPKKGLAAGKLDFTLAGERLRGRWSLVRMRGRAGEKAEHWLLVKRSDAGNGARATAAGLDRSVSSGRSMAEIAAAADRAWSSTAGEQPPAPAKQALAPARRRAARTQPAGPIAPGAADLPGAKPAAQPNRLAPQLATLVDAAPDGDEWVHEVKFDGYRLLAFRDGSSVRLRTRTGQDWSARFPAVARAIAALPVQRAIVDGEVVVLAPDGTSDFQALQNWIDRGGSGALLAYFAFDLPHCDGCDLTQSPLLARKELLQRLLAGQPASSPLRYSEHVTGHGPVFLAKACGLSLEGALCKRADSPYASRRTRSWLKVKCLQRQELVVGGWTPPEGQREHFGALLLGVYDDTGLRYAGKVGTGFTRTSLAEIMRILRALAAPATPFVDPPKGAEGRRAHWVRPECVVEVTFTGWTADGRLRHPSCQGVREDKDARTIRRERPQPPPRAGDDAERNGAAAAPAPARRNGSTEVVAGVRITHPDRVLWTEPRTTKADLARYYEAVADHILPHVAGRPLTLVRCPNGPAGGCFYQKHIAPTLPEPVRAWRVKEAKGGADYVGIDDVRGLVTLVQFGALELHPWGSRGKALERPDRIVIDLDPGPGVAWRRVIDAARHLHGMFQALGLQSFARTSGGKGLHVVVPIAPRSTWTEVKTFANDVTALLAREEPKAFVLTASKAARKGRIFLDWLRNARGATAVASYSSRARAGAPVAMPVRWQDVDERLDPLAFTVRTVPKLLATRADPWRGFFARQQALTAAMRAAVRTR